MPAQSLLGGKWTVGFDPDQYHAWSRALPLIHSDGEMNRHGEWAAATLAMPQFFRKS